MQKLDDKILYFINDKLNFKWLELLLKFFTFLGDFCLIWIIATVALFFTGHHELAKQLVISMLIVNAVNNGLIKAVVRRSRPFEDHTDIRISIDNPYGSSFPSGHSANGFCCAYVISYYYPALGTIAYLVAAGIALSRMGLKVHYFTDVLSGSIVGILTAWLYILWL